MTGTVYLFNTTTDVLKMTLNETVLTTEFAAVQASNGYQPTEITAARNPSSGNPGLAQFGGTNVLTITYGSNGTSTTYGVVLTSVPIGNDVQLYVFDNLLTIPLPVSCIVFTPATAGDALHRKGDDGAHR